MYNLESVGLGNEKLDEDCQIVEASSTPKIDVVNPTQEETHASQPQNKRAKVLTYDA